MPWLAILVALVSCSSKDREPLPAPAPHDQGPVLTEAARQDLGRKIRDQAHDAIDAGTSPCSVPPTLPRAEVRGAYTVVSFGGKTTHNAVADLDTGRFAIFAGATVRAGRTSLRNRLGTDDLARPLVVELYHSGRAFDAVSGTLVIDQTKPVLAGHLEDADLRERAYDYAYVPDGCTTHVDRIDFVFEPASRQAE